MAKIGIYKYTNKINGKIYIGQSSNIQNCGIVIKYMANPVANKKINYSGRTVKNINTGLEFLSISKAAKWAGCGATTLTRHLYTDKIAGKVPDTNEPAEWVEIL